MSDPKTAITAGLFIKDAARKRGSTGVVPLAGVSVDAEIRRFYTKVVVAQRYVNHETTPIEAVYVFPLPEGAAVCGFEAIVDGTLVVGEVQERDKAFEMYDDAMEQGHGAFLLDEERPDVFQASVGNLPPGKEVTVKLTYVTELSVDDGRLRFVIPTTVSPRYAPAEDRVGTGRSDDEALNPPVAWSVPYGLSVSVQISTDSHGAISGVESPSHPISVKLTDFGAMVTLSQKDAALDRDFVLSIDAPRLDAPQVLVERDDHGTEAIGIAFAPVFETPSAPVELIFLVDRSGSMAGTSIVEVRNALQLCLRSMTPGCRFNIVGFGSRYESLFSRGTRAYDQSSLEKATAHVAAMEADLGGTELLPALQSVLEEPASAELPRQVVILTDGQATNTDAVLALAKKHGGSRIFTFGIGAGASEHLVRGLARAGGGTAEFIYPGERIEPKVLRQVARLLSPALTDVRVEWTGGEVTQAPTRIPPVFARGRLLVYGFVKGRRPSAVRLTAMSPSGPLSFDVPVPDVAPGSCRTVSTLAARARIRELEEGSEWLATRGSQQNRRRSSSASAEIIELSLRYGLMSRETSFVAIERRERPVIGDVKLRKVPIALTTGWGGLQRVSVTQVQIGTVDASLLTMCDEAMPLPAAAMSRAAKPLARAGGWFDRLAHRRPSIIESARPSKEAPLTGMHALIVLQAADGSWDLTNELASLIGRNLADLRSAMDEAKGSRDDVRRAWATSLALAWLEQNAADAQDEWRLLAEKGRQWIDATPALPPGGGTWSSVAKKFLRP